MVEGSTNSPGANLNIAAKQDGPKGGGQDARNNPTRPTIFSRFFLDTWFLLCPQNSGRFKNDSETILPAQFLKLRQLPAQR
jgi:hypothetical protein